MGVVGTVGQVARRLAGVSAALGSEVVFSYHGLVAPRH
jgi:hypothetical protein